MQTAEDVLTFWFIEHAREHWFGGGPEFDAKLSARFGETLLAVAAGEAWTWRITPEGRLAEILVLDQFSRQIWRGEPRAFAQDAMALALAQEAVAGGHDRALDPQKRMFLYMPYMHSESLLVHEAALPLFESLDMEDVLTFEHAHADVLRRFGRYPRRNQVLGRQSTGPELAYIASDEGKW